MYVRLSFSCCKFWIHKIWILLIHTYSQRNHSRRYRYRPPPPTSATDLQRPPLPTSTDLRDRPPPTSATGKCFLILREHIETFFTPPTSATDLRLRPPLPTSASDLRYRPPPPTSDLRYRPPPISAASDTPIYGLDMNAPIYGLVRARMAFQGIAILKISSMRSVIRNFQNFLCAVCEFFVCTVWWWNILSSCDQECKLGCEEEEQSGM